MFSNSSCTHTCARTRVCNYSFKFTSTGLSNSSLTQYDSKAPSHRRYVFIQQYPDSCPLSNPPPLPVYGEAPIGNGDIKGDQKKPSHTPTFIKPKIPQLDDNRLQVKVQYMAMYTQPFFPVMFGFCSYQNKSRQQGSQGSTQGFTVAMTDSHSGRGGKPLQRTSRYPLKIFYST